MCVVTGYETSEWYILLSY